jgi:hypothetical protein
MIRRLKILHTQASGSVNGEEFALINYNQDSVVRIEMSATNGTTGTAYFEGLIFKDNSPQWLPIKAKEEVVGTEGISVDVSTFANSRATWTFNPNGFRWIRVRLDTVAVGTLDARGILVD